MQAIDPPSLHAHFAGTYDNYEPEKKIKVKEMFGSHWVSVAKVEGHNYLVNGSYIQNTPNGLIQAGIKTTIIQDDHEISSDYSIIKFEFDCERRKYHILSSIDYFPESNKRPITHELPDSELELIHYDTVSYEIARAVCMMNYALTH